MVINEYMPWVTNDNNCPTNAEYVELYNFGPGPVDIGCYILTEGDYAVTIPKGTVLQPGQYYVISGVDVIAGACLKTTTGVRVDLNWNNCDSCLSEKIKEQDGLFADGGGSKDPVVLLDRDLKVVDAVARTIPTGTSKSITTLSSINGCGPKTFSLTHAQIPYETIDVANGRANTYARSIDGSCTWIKDPKQTPGASNGTGTGTTISYDLTYIKPMACEGNLGAVSIRVTPETAFPLNYIFAYDGNDGQFSLEDLYVHGTANTPPRLDFSSLQTGKYLVTMSSAKGCDLKTAPFDILPCNPALPIQVLSFKLKKTHQNRLTFEWTLGEVESAQTIILEKSSDNITFTTATQQHVNNNSHGTQTFTVTLPAAEENYYRLRIKEKSGAVVYSNTINTNTSVTTPVGRLWPNPAKDFINIETGLMLSPTVSYKIYNMSGGVAAQGTLHIGEYQYAFQLPVHGLPKGVYQLFVNTSNNTKPVSFRFIKE